MLCAHLVHSVTPLALEWSPAEAAGWFTGVLAEAVGHPVPEPVATVVTSWAHDPLTGGAYTHSPPGTDPSMLELLGQPVHGRLLLAGEHTHSERNGYADGRLRQRTSSGGHARGIGEGLRPERPRAAGLPARWPHPIQCVNRAAPG